MNNSVPEPAQQGTRSAPSLTVGIVFVRNMLSGLTARGISCDEWLIESGIDPDLLIRDGARVSLHVLARLLRAIMEGRDDEGLGLLSRPSKRGSFALQARSAIGAPTLEVAIRHVAHVFRLLYDDVSMVRVSEHDAAGVAFHIHDPVIAANSYLHEFLLQVYWHLFAWLVGGDLQPVRFDFAFSRPPYSDEYGTIFPAPWRFEATLTAMWFSSDRMNLPVCRDDVALRSFVADGPINVILPSSDRGMAGRVRNYLQRTRPGWPSFDCTARAFNISRSALQRHLATEGTSFRQLKDQLRRDLAILRLQTSEQPLVKLATELGFADAPAFQRSFKRWTGLPPGAYRQGRR